MGSNYLNYNVDIVFVIDATMSMYKILDKVKANAINFYQDLTNTMQAKGKRVDTLRARVITFRDYIYDMDNAMMDTDFFHLPEQSKEFAACIKSIIPDGGGDEPEDALEALAYAIRSDWNNDTASEGRHVIVLWTDASPHDLGFGKSSASYPKGMPKDINELSEWWGAPGIPGYMNEHRKRLLLYAPECATWDLINQSWDNNLYYPSEAGNGLEEHDYKAILHAIADSIA